MATSLGLGQVNHLLVVVEGVVEAHMALDHLGLAPGAPHLHLAASFHLLTFFLGRARLLPRPLGGGSPVLQLCLLELPAGRLHAGMPPLE